MEYIFPKDFFVGDGYCCCANRGCSTKGWKRIIDMGRVFQDSGEK